MAAWSKAIANGHALAAVTGNDRFREGATRIFTTGSFWTASVSMAAAIAKIRKLDAVDAVGHMRANTSYAHAMGFRAGALIAIASAETGPAQANQVRKLGFSVGRCFLFDGEGRTIACGREGI